MKFFLIAVMCLGAFTQLPANALASTAMFVHPGVLVSGEGIATLKADIKNGA